MKYEVSKELLQFLHGKGNPETKELINQYFPDLFKVGAQPCGVRFQAPNGEEYILAQPEQKMFCLINLKTGCRFAGYIDGDFILEDGTYKVVSHVVEKLTEPHGFKLIS